MKSTDIKRRDREIRRSRKKEEFLQRKVENRDNMSVGEFINKLSSLFFHDDKKIYNLDNEEILELLEDLRISQPEKQWDNVLRKAIRKTKIAQREEAFNHLKEYLTD